MSYPVLYTLIQRFSQGFSKGKQGMYRRCERGLIFCFPFLVCQQVRIVSPPFPFPSNIEKILAQNGKGDSGYTPKALVGRSDNAIKTPVKVYVFPGKAADSIAENQLTVFTGKSSSGFISPVVVS